MRLRSRKDNPSRDHTAPHAKAVTTSWKPAPKLTAACEPGGHLLLSGLLKTQAYAVRAAYGAAFDKVQVIERDDWCCIYARRGA